MEKKKFGKNSGFSLVEILVTVAILSILTAGVGVGISLAGSRDAQKSALLVNDALENTRINGMSMSGDYTLTLDMEKMQYTIESSVKGIVKEEMLPQRVTAVIAGYETAKKLTVSFDNAAGAVKRMQADGEEIADILELTFENPQGKKAVVVLVKATGKHYVE